MQLCPHYATVSRPVYWDRAGFLYLDVECPECKGDGEVSFGSINPSERDGHVACECCRGTGRVYEEVAEDGL